MKIDLTTKILGFDGDIADEYRFTPEGETVAVMDGDKPKALTLGAALEHALRFAKDRRPLAGDFKVRYGDLRERVRRRRAEGEPLTLSIQEAALLQEVVGMLYSQEVAWEVCRLIEAAAEPQVAA